MVESVSCRSATTALRRQAILKAALQSFLSKGYTDTTMDDIRQLSGASTGSIYHHFENKEKLALALHIEGRNDLNAHLVAAFANHDAEAGVKALVNTYCRWMTENLELGQFMLQADSIEYLGEEIQLVYKVAEVLSKQAMEWLYPFIETGVVKRYPQELYVPLIFGPLREMMRLWFRYHSSIDFQEVGAQLAEAIWTSLRAG